MAPYQERLEHAMLTDRIRELAERLGFEARADLLARRPDLVDRDHLRHHRPTVSRHRDQSFQTAAESSHPWLRHLRHLLLAISS
jgi:hypothetical protein